MAAAPPLQEPAHSNLLSGRRDWGCTVQGGVQLQGGVTVGRGVTSQGAEAGLDWEALQDENRRLG